MAEQYEVFMSVRQFFDVFGVRLLGEYIKGIVYKYS